MSAITGLYYREGRPLDRTILDRMSGTLALRGSDGSAVWCDGNVGLGHRMSWTTPESLQESLPLVDESREFVITADARIDNRDELLSALVLNARPSEIADSQLILAAYKKWGEGCPEKIIGDFAFAIWDRRRQILFCARDPIGVKPFYYFLSDRVFVFASEIKALFCVGDVPCELNERRVADHLLSVFEDKVATFYRNIFRLPPAHSLTVGNGVNRLHRYWSLDPSLEVRLASDQEYAEAFRDIFTTAVRSRLRSSFPVGSSLSGGLDSSSVACTARMLLAQDGRRLHTYSAIFPGLREEDLAKIDEREYINAVLELADFEPHFVRADYLGPLADLDRVLWHEDEPFIAPNLYLHWALYGAARQDGVQVFLDGLDGDTTVSHGLDYLSELARKGKFWTLMREAGELSRKSPNRYFTSRRIAWEYGFRNLIPNGVENLARRFLGRQKPNGIEGVINPSFAGRMKLAGLAGETNNHGTRTKKKAREAHCESLESGLIPYTLELADRASAAFGIEARYPFFDRRLIEFCLALPADQKLRRGWTRSVMRRAMTGILPRKVQWRIGKGNLSPNFKRRLLDYGRPIIEEIINKEPHLIEGFVDMPVLRAAYERYRSQPVRGDQDALTVYNAVMLGCWLRRSGFMPASDQARQHRLAGTLGSEGWAREAGPLQTGVRL